MKEITDKLAYELIQYLDEIEGFCDRKAKEGRPSKYDVDTDWMTVSCMCFSMRAHLYHHMKEMIKHESIQNNQE